MRHLLVVDKSRLVGIISDRDIKRALDPNKTKKKVMSVGGLYFLIEPILVEEIMTRSPKTISPGESAQDAALVMLANRFGALPVVQSGRPVGIITETDLLRHFATQKDAKSSTTTRPQQRKPPTTSRKKTSKR